MKKRQHIIKPFDCRPEELGVAFREVAIKNYGEDAIEGIEIKKILW